MGYGIMISLDDEDLICQKPCEHTDCAHWKDFVARAKCNICNKPILQGGAYYGIDLEKLEHAMCVI